MVPLGPAIFTVILWLTLVLFAGGEAAASLEERVTKHRLANGLTLLLLERHHAPIVAINLTYKVGSVHEQAGMTGLAHLYEHMAFKGTRTIGVTDARKEQPVLGKLDRAAAALAAESAKGPKADAGRLTFLRRELERLSTLADSFVVPSELAALYQRHGGVGLNATTGKDLTRYFVSLPANRLPLWALVESDRMANIVLREFYKEKHVVLEERRQRVDNAPSGRLFEAFTAAAFHAHPYGLPVIGWPSDLEALTRAQTQAFFDTYYGPGNAVIALVGDFDVRQTIQLIERTFGRIPARPPSPPVHTVELPQTGERRIEVEYPAEPHLLIGFRKPAIGHPDDPVLDVIAALLSEGWTSRLHRRLVQERQIAASVAAFSDYPGAQYPNLFVVSAMPRAPHRAGEVEAAVYEELERLTQEPVTARELEKILNQIDADHIRSLRSNSGMASRLAYFEAIAGDWRELLRQRDRIATVTPADIQRVAAAYFTKSNRTVAILVKPAAAAETAP